VLEAMRLYLNIMGDEGADIDSLSPYQVRQLLQKVLTVSQWAIDDKYVWLVYGIWKQINTHALRNLFYAYTAFY
jgi:hypothetical protein